MDKNNNLFSFCIILSIIVLFNVLQAEKKENINLYSWASSFDQIESKNHMGKLGFVIMKKNDQEKMKSDFCPLFPKFVFTNE